VVVMDRVVDELGLVPEGGLMTLYFPCYESAIVFRVRSRENKGFEAFDYGPLPLSAGTPLPTYEGTSTTVPADGVLPARSYTRDALTFPAPAFMSTSVFDRNDVFRLSKDDADALFHVRLFVHPPLVRVEVRMPSNVPQYGFQRRRASVGVDTLWIGARRGSAEAVHFPQVQTGYRFGNDAYWMDLRTFVRFVFGEYRVEVPKSPELVFDVLAKRAPSYWLTLPVFTRAEPLEEVLTKCYGFPTVEGRPKLFKLYRADERERALKDYAEIMSQLRV